jgi:hypothetical protein
VPAYHVASLGGTAGEDEGHCLAASENHVIGCVQELAALKLKVLRGERACGGEAGKDSGEEGVDAHVEARRMA